MTDQEYEEEGTAAAEAQTGPEVIRAYLKELSNGPGVYRMLDRQGAVLYVGKARSLKKRVASYAKPTGHSPRIGRMVSATASMMFLTTETEIEALLLEQNLIKQLKPRYNVLLRDDKSFPFIFISTEHDFPRLEKHRGAKTRKGRYYGPFASAGAVNRTINTLQKVFLLRSCTDREVEAGDRPCLNFHLKRCAGPCGGRISKEDYAKLVTEADDFLRGRTTKVQGEMARQMEEASGALEFERAAALRDRIRALSHVQSAQGINPEGVEEADVVALHADEGQACVQVFFIRSNQNWGNRAYFPRTGAGAEPGELLEAFLVQFYDNKTPPRRLLLSHNVDNADLLEAALTQKRGRRVEVLVPQRGEKAMLVDGALRNAREALGRKMAESASQARLLQGLADAFDLDAPPQRIEVYDNSHIQGAHAVGAMIVSGPEGFLKSSYRKFNIRSKDLTPGDDFGMMREVLDRRFTRLLKEDPDRDKGDWPDLLLIDGGAGQVSAVAAALAEVGVDDVEVIGVAKGVDRNAGKEEFYRPSQPVKALPHRDPVLYFVQRLRDEAHRFAIGAHRAKRSKAISSTPLDEVPGVGPARKRALLAHFGSAKAVSRAGLADLKSVEGVSDQLAEKIYAFFNAAH
ncbi:MAG: excinuclease ABC subunit UvrC [Pseudomonadota bacterium]